MYQLFLTLMLQAQMTSDISSWRWERLKIFSAIPPAILPKQTQGGRTFIFVIYSKRSVSKRIHLWLLSQSINRPGFRIRYLLYSHIMLLFRGSTLFLQMQLLTLLNYFLLTLPYFIYQNFDNATKKNGFRRNGPGLLIHYITTSAKQRRSDLCPPVWTV